MKFIAVFLAKALIRVYSVTKRKTKEFSNFCETCCDPQRGLLCHCSGLIRFENQNQVELNLISSAVKTASSILNAEMGNFSLECRRAHFPADTALHHEQSVQGRRELTGHRKIEPESFSILLVLKRKRYAVVLVRFTEFCRSWTL